jgi:hypothetical protein
MNPSLQRPVLPRQKEEGVILRSVHFKGMGRAIGLSVVLLAAGTGHGEAGGFREQMGWQFRSPSETQTNLNKEALRLQLEQQGTVVGGAAGGSVSVPLSSGGAGLSGGGLGGSSATLGNQTNTTTNVTINVTGDGNDVTVDNYLNLEAEQTTDGQTSNIGSGANR